MKRINLTGLCLVAMVAFVAMATSSAYAGEYGVCLKTAKVGRSHTGNWNDRACEKERNPEKRGEFEWWPGRTGIGQPGVTAEDFEYPNPEPKALESAEESGPSELWSEAGTVICIKNVPKGAVLGTQYNVDTIVFKRCTLNTTRGKCTGVGEPEGEIVWFSDTYLIDHGTLGSSGLQPQEGEVWNAYFASEGSPYYPYLAIFECAGNPVHHLPAVMFRYSGQISGVVTPVGKMTHKKTVSFAEKVGEQDLVTEYSENGGVTWNVTGTYSITFRSNYMTKDRSKIEIRDCNEIGAVSEGKGAQPCESEEPLPW